ncbi:hypothetical protein OSB04_009571 [Centaurea solstitialis]|uniref:Uncharacterized protein n=1 Tax=Centaurea solstitialis TaxID=347529 RepID=A0AA38WC16_9ASTR|nr:hypothetical protein OSB04_009571 [Centaurea solstitialis]
MENHNLISLIRELLNCMQNVLQISGKLKNKPDIEQLCFWCQYWYTTIHFTCLMKLYSL